MAIDSEDWYPAVIASPPRKAAWFYPYHFWHLTGGEQSEVVRSGTGAVTLKMLTVAATGQLSYPGTGAITLPFLRVQGGPGDSPGAITLRALTVSGTGTVTARAYLNHDLFWKYKTDDLKVAWVKRYAGSRQVQVSRRVPPHTIDQPFAAAFIAASTIALTLYSSQDVSVRVNAQTFDVLKNYPLIWTNDSAEAYPFVADVSTIYVSNLGDMSARFTVSVLILDERIG